MSWSIRRMLGGTLFNATGSAERTGDHDRLLPTSRLEAFSDVIESRLALNRGVASVRSARASSIRTTSADVGTLDAAVRRAGPVSKAQDGVG